MLSRPLKPLLAISAVINMASAAHAAVVTSGTVMNQTAYPGWDAVHLLDQSGLSLGYTSGVTDFSSYLAASPTHIGTSTNPSSGWFSPGPARVDIDLGSTMTVTDLILWNDNDSQGVRDFEVLLADDASFTGAVSLGVFSATFGPNNYAVPVEAQAFNLADAQGRYVRVNFNASHAGAGMNINVGEIAFGTGVASPVPEPSPLALLTAALLSAGILRRKRDASVARSRVHDV